MAYFFRLAFLLLCVVLDASAGAPTILYGYRTPDYVNPPAVIEPRFSTANEACAAGLPLCGGNCGGIDGWTGFADGPICNKYKPGVGVSGPIGSWFEKMSCPASEKLENGQCVPDGPKQCAQGSELVNGQCQCKPGFKQGDGACYPDPDAACSGLQQWCSDKQGFRTEFEGRGQGADFFCHAAEKFIAGAGGGGSSWEPEFPGCSKGCMITSGSTTISAQDNSGQWWTKGLGKYVGSTCDPDVINKLNEGTPEEKEVKPPSTKGPGKCNGQQGTYNGVEVCLPYEKVTGDDKSKTETGADGSKKETTTKTTCTYSQCTTETKVVDKDKNGNTTGTSTTVVNAPKDEYCARNTASAVCKGLNPNDKGSGNGTGTGGTGGGNGTGGNGNGEDDGDKSSFGGSCQAGFTCEGDALQCAIVREQHRRNCELFEKDTDANSLTNRAINGSDDKSADAMRDRAQQVSVGTFDQAGLGWSSSCPADPSIPLNFGGTSSEFKIPFSRICGPLSILSSAGVGITLLGCMVWVLGGKKSSA
ncbi:EB domain-containing protein [Delftia tsuruhatensis]|nr:EB domain-containing protein [Delftia tsuruhatensis]